MKMRLNRGITIIEVVVIVLIIAVLAVITIPAAIDFTGGTADRSRSEETRAVVTAAQNAVDRILAAGMPVEEINGNTELAQNLRSRILFAAGASGEIVSFHVSTGVNVDRTEEAKRNPAPKDLDFSAPGTLEFLEYKGSKGNWFGQYRILANDEPQIRIMSSPQGGPNVTVGAE